MLGEDKDVKHALIGTEIEQKFNGTGYIMQ